jgi:hypothetical protein
VHAPAAALQPPAAQDDTAVEVVHPAAVATHAPLHSVKPLAQTNVHALLTHTGSAFATVVEHAFPHVMQLSTLLVVSTQLLVQIVDAVDGQLGAHAYVPSTLTHTGVLSVHALSQPPQLDALAGF